MDLLNYLLFYLNFLVVEVYCFLFYLVLVVYYLPVVFVVLVV